MTVAVIGTATLRLADLVIPAELSRELRRAEDFINLAVVVAQQVVLSSPSLDGQRTGIYLGTAFGPMACNLSVLDDLVKGVPISPTLFSHSVFNAASGYIARICKIHGPALTLTSHGWPFFRALQCGWQAIKEKKVDHALIIQVETYSAFLAEARTAMLPGAAPPWPAGATAWLLGHNGPCRLDTLSVREEPCAPEARLARQESSPEGEKTHPLSAVEALTALIASHNVPENWQRTGDYGRVNLTFSRGEN